MTKVIRNRFATCITQAALGYLSDYFKLKMSKACFSICTFSMGLG